MPALNRKKRRDLARFHDPPDIRRRRRKFDLILVFIKQRLHGIAEIQGPAYGLRTAKKNRDPQREEGRVHLALAQPRKIYVTHIVSLPQILAHDYALNRVDV